MRFLIAFYYKFNRKCVGGGGKHSIRILIDSLEEEAHMSLESSLISIRNSLENALEEEAPSSTITSYY
jgi:hypothetical protein